MLDLRDYQVETVERIRELIRQGKKNILVVSPTGSGKTVIATHMVGETSRRGNRAVFVVDRLSLIEQTSRTFYAEDIQHGVIQADHPQYKPWELVQVCSQQTLARRKWPDASVIFVDEAHTVTKTVKHRIYPRDTVAIGLTATPFTKGLGQIYDAVVNVTTTNKLIADGHLANYRIFAPSEPDMTGVKVVAGEWEEKEAASKAMEVVGDCVAEYLKRGEGRKFICSAVNVDHVMELQRQFMAAGIVCATYTYKDLADDRADIVREFRKADSNIRGLITVTAASKGFDVPDIGVVIMARPLRKSLAEHIQFFGRGLRTADGKSECLVLDHCIATGSRVLTHRGLVEIQKVLISDTLWDGRDFVAHKGVISRGIRPVIRYAGLTATADHPVKTNEGWRTLGYCSEKQTPVVTTAFGGRAVRECENYFTASGLARLEGTPLYACAVRVRRLWVSVNHCLQQLDRWAHQRLSILQSAASVSEMVVCAGSGYGAALHEPSGERVRAIRREGDQVPFRLSDHLRSLAEGEHWNPRERQGFGVGPDQQRRPLRAGKHSMGVETGQLNESALNEKLGCRDAQIQAGASTGSLRGLINSAAAFLWSIVRGNSKAVGTAVPEAKGEVWDILDCGPRNSFTCEGLLVHNSGNCKRFWDEWNDFFETGAVELDDGKKKEKEKKKKEPKEREMAVCPSCSHVHMALPHCPACGHEYPLRGAVQHVAGTLSELVASHNRAAMTTQLWPQICYHARTKRADAEAARKMALALFKNMTGVWPTHDFHSTEPKPLTKEVSNKIKSMQIAWAKGRAAHA